MEKYEKALEYMKSQGAWIDPCEFSEENQKLYIELLEKATPYKVRVGINYKGSYLEQFYGDCKCGKRLHFEQKYCSECGQRLEWNNGKE